MIKNLRGRAKKRFQCFRGRGRRARTGASLELSGDAEHPAAGAALARPTSEFGRQRSVVADGRRAVDSSQDGRAARNFEREERRGGTRRVEQPVDGAAVDGDVLDVQADFTTVRVVAAAAADVAVGPTGRRDQPRRHVVVAVFRLFSTAQPHSSVIGIVTWLVREWTLPFPRATSMPVD